MLELPRYHGAHWLKRTQQFFALWLIMMALGYVALYVNSGRFVANHVVFLNQRVAGMEREEAVTVVKDHLAKLEQRQIQLAGASTTHPLTPLELGFRFDAEKTVTALFEAGRSLWLKAELLSFGGKDEIVRIEPALILDPDHLKTVVAEKLTSDEKPLINAKLVWTPDFGWTIAKERPGIVLASGEAERITQAILDDIYAPPEKPLIYQARYETLEPKIIASELELMLQEVKALTQLPLQIQFGKVTEPLNLSLDPAKWFTLDYASKTVSPRLNQIASFAANFSARHDLFPSEVVVKNIEEVPSEYAEDETYKRAVIEGEFRTGRQIDQDHLITGLTAALSTKEPRTITVLSKTIPVKIKSEVENFEFPELVSVGQSSYALGNKPNRVHNIKRALELQDLTVLAPGEIFSYNKVLGWVTYQKGYVDGQVIFGNALANVAGGGVCQTSTTMFRAAVNAGLPIVERRNHSWDVHYYQDWHGVDSTVYPPGKVDLKFVNDTPGPLLVHSYADDENEIAYFELYGTKDGREVTVVMKENVKRGAARHIVNEWEVRRPDGIIEKREIVSHYNR